ncbi:MAG TPA: DUF948 domain-containing protein [Candidatus Limnocylindria bacterium]|nr:DUF948 domain-containing protein [Candidatus Limnocylindria bacterium]
MPRRTNEDPEGGMDLVSVIFNVGVGLGVLLAGAALLLLVLNALPLLAETRGLSKDSRRVVALVEREMQPILAHSRELAANAEVLSEDVAVKLDRLNDLMNALQRTLESVQVTAIPRRPGIGSVESADAREDERFS